MSWVVKGYIAKVEGFEINWAKASACTTIKKNMQGNNGKDDEPTFLKNEWQ